MIATIDWAILRVLAWYWLLRRYMYGTVRYPYS
mgnify:CR=1 FL=1